MARIFDPTKGTVFLDGVDIRSYSSAERSKKIGFILQEPFLFTGTVGENIIYGNDMFLDTTLEQLEEVIKSEGLSELLKLFDNGLETKVETGGESISLDSDNSLRFCGQCFVSLRYLSSMRQPQILIPSPSNFLRRS